MLADAQIRIELIKSLRRRANKPLAIVEELRFHDGNAIADVVAIYKSMHAYEIKGEGDNVSRLRLQGPYYDSSFPLITLVTTKDHLPWARANLGSHWGIIEAYRDEMAEVKLRHIRKSSTNPLFCKKLSLSMLWREELATIGNRLTPSLVNKSDSREKLIKKVYSSLTKQSSVELLSELVAGRSISKRVKDIS